ncbi:gag-pol polyprotein [Trifolium medium]|uniref:Gag-pol polyprotein n=1 Tax=Trifolium medium TaxID=97028 RepID=A0A392T9J9_9FABA|nr:gag-pol polyprotein [Trifolium medium]
MVEPIPLPPAKQPYPPGFDMNARCDYHAGSPGHRIEDCRAFKLKVQELIDLQLILFKKEPHSGVVTPAP